MYLRHLELPILGSIPHHDALIEMIAADIPVPGAVPLQDAQQKSFFSSDTEYTGLLLRNFPNALAAIEGSRNWSKV
jgi:hypothetical protein